MCYENSDNLIVYLFHIGMCRSTSNDWINWNNNKQKTMQFFLLAYTEEEITYHTAKIVTNVVKDGWDRKQL